MRQIADYSDDRYKGACIHCGCALAAKTSSDDHIPSKVLLDRPLPANVHVVKVCSKCNTGFSLDEEYFAALLGAAMAGSTEPDRQIHGVASGIFAANAKLRRQIEAAKVVTNDSFGNTRTTWQPEITRVRRVVVKNARGHVFYELRQPMLGDPDDVMIVPLVDFDEE